jgi:poly(A) polymerase
LAQTTLYFVRVPGLPLSSNSLEAAYNRLALHEVFWVLLLELGDGGTPMKKRRETLTTIEKAKAIVSRLVEAGYPAYFVGGTVRDMLMGRTPSDIDVATGAPPEVVSELFERTVAVGKQFGVLLVVIEEETFEVATFRKEGPYEDGRHPAWVSPADARADVARRDFTLNGLLYDPIRYEVFDWVGGRKDIEKNLVRSIGEPRRRFAEDKLRLLRAVRFASTLDFEVEGETGRVLIEMAPEIRTVSGERIRDELIKMFTGPNPHRGLELLDRYELLEPILPEISRMKGIEQGERFHPEGDAFEHTVKILSYLSKPTVTLAFAALLHDVGKPPTLDTEGSARFPNHAKVGAEMSRAVLDRLRFDHRKRDIIVDMVENHLRFLDVRKMRPATLRRFLSRKNFDEELELHRLDCLAGSGDMSNYTFAREKLEELEHQPLPKPPLLRGKDLLDLGFTPGPRIGRILNEVEDKRLEGELKSKKEAMSWVKEHFDPVKE